MKLSEVFESFPAQVTYPTSITGTDRSTLSESGKSAIEEQGAASNPPAPFKIYKTATANVFKVLAGTCEGQLIATQNINVGSTRPVAIHAYPQYTMTIYSSEYVHAMAVKTGASAPVLTTSTTVFGDVASGITSAGNEARAVIGYIYFDGTNDQISQLATGNIYGSWGDDGSLTGKATGVFVKNA